MSHVLPEFKRAVGNAEIDIETADWRVMLVMLNSTVPTEKVGIVDLTDYTTLDEFDGAGYVRKTLSSVVFDDDTNDWILTADDVTWTAQAAGTRNIAGALLYIHPDVPAIYYSLPGAPIGDDVRILWPDGVFLKLE